VIATEDATGERRLVGYVVGAARAAAEVDALREQLRARLPDHMVPSVIVPIDTMPLTASGKVDRHRLPDPASVSLGDDADYVAPRDETEAAIAEMWAELLAVPRVGVEDDFFALGGHSLLAAQVIARIVRDFGVHLPLHSLFVAPTVAALSELVVVELLAEAGGDEDLAAILAELDANETADGS